MDTGNRNFVKPPNGAKPERAYSMEYRLSPARLVPLEKIRTFQKYGNDVFKSGHPRTVHWLLLSLQKFSEEQ
jgi:hypothetical protein